MNSLMNFMLKRINEASGPYQMFGQLVDLVVLDKFSFSCFHRFFLLAYFT